MKVARSVLRGADCSNVIRLLDYHPETPTTASSSIKKLVKAKRTLYRALASNQSKVVRPFDEETFNARLQEHCATLMPAESALVQANAELFNFFSNKKLAEPLKVETIAPPPAKKAGMVNREIFRY